VGARLYLAPLKGAVLRLLLVFSLRVAMENSARNRSCELAKCCTGFNFGVMLSRKEYDGRVWLKVGFLVSSLIEAAGSSCASEINSLSGDVVKQVRKEFNALVVVGEHSLAKLACQLA